jgi:hypothetical protein
LPPARCHRATDERSTVPSRAWTTHSDHAAVSPVRAQQVGRSAAGPGHQAKAQQPFGRPCMSGRHARKAEAVGQIETRHYAAILNCFSIVLIPRN